MIIGTGKIYLLVHSSHSLKDKRMVVKSIIDKVKHRYNVSIAEIDNQDFQQSIVIGIACISNEKKQVIKVINQVLRYIEANTEAVVEDIETEIF